ncbi:MAG: DNA repair protein RadC [Theionarchaea archaeon]|nr:DNA repair protein RadC [Theionarchaea archaeon]
MSSPKDSEPKGPKERLAKYGAERLSIYELLIVLISPGCNRRKAAEIAADLLETFDRNLVDVFTATIHQLTQVEGIGFVKACKIKAAFELMKRINSYCKEMHPEITSAKDVVKLVAAHMKYLKQEEFRVLLLDGKNRLIRHQRVSLGSLDKALVHPRDVFRPAIAEGAASIILVHNHPSGDPTPSKQDLLLTRELYMCGKVVDIEVLDHVIIGISDHVSLKDLGKM